MILQENTPTVKLCLCQPLAFRHLRVRRLPDAPQLVRLYGAVAGELQEPLHIVEDGQLVVGERDLHLPSRAETRHLGKMQTFSERDRTDLLTYFGHRYLFRYVKLF